MSVDMDILVLGATGFTGRLITRYLFAHPQRKSFTFGIAARSRSKLDALALELGLDSTVHLIQVDVANFAQIESAVIRTRVVINAVGPYRRWGTPVVHACVRHGRHYVDLAGETHWIKSIIEKYDYYATKTGAIIIPSCGFDSMPSDISAFLSNATVKSALGPDASVESSVTAIRIKGGSISGGTLATAILTFEEVSRSELAASTTPYSLSPLKGRIQSKKMFYRLTPHMPSIQGAFFFMTPSNKAIVERTWGLHELEAHRTESRTHSDTTGGTSNDNNGKVRTLHEMAKRLSYGPQFVYDEFIITRNVFMSLLVNIGSAFVAFCLLTPPIRWVIKRVGLQSGEGPSEETMRNSYMETINVSATTATTEVPQVHVKSVTRGKGDPGYSLTSVMIAEAALSIALSHKDLPELGRRGGVLTPMSALGDVLLERLKGSGKFEFDSHVMES